MRNHSGKAAPEFMFLYPKVIVRCLSLFEIDKTLILERLWHSLQLRYRFSWILLGWRGRSPSSLKWESLLEIRNSNGCKPINWRKRSMKSDWWTEIKRLITIGRAVKITWSLNKDTHCEEKVNFTYWSSISLETNEGLNRWSFHRAWIYFD